MPSPRSTFALALAVVLAAIVAPASAQLLIPGARKTPERLTAERLVKVRVTPDVASLRPGVTFHLAVIFEIEPGWHIYWLDPGAAGAPTEVAVRAPLGYTVGNTLYPRPKTIPDPAGDSYGYEGEVALFVPITAPPQLMPSQASVSFDVDVYYFVCKEQCLVGKTQRTARVDVANPRKPETTPAPVPGAKIIDRYKQRLPRPLTEIKDGAVRVERTPEPSALVISGATTGVAEDKRGLSFLPASAPGVTYGEPEVEIDGERFVIRVPFELRRQNALGRRLHASGLIMIGKSSDQPSYQVDVDLDARRPWEEHE